MKIEMNTIYHLPTQAHEDDFLKQADKQGLEWGTGHGASYLKYWDDCKEQYCINVANTGLGYSDKEFYQTDDKFNQLPIVEWKIGFTKADMQIGQAYKTGEGFIFSWEGMDNLRYTDNLCCIDINEHKPELDIVEVYSVNLTPIWKRPEPKYRVKTELTKEQAEKHLCRHTFCE